MVWCGLPMRSRLLSRAVYVGNAVDVTATIFGIAFVVIIASHTYLSPWVLVARLVFNDMESDVLYAVFICFFEILGSQFLPLHLSAHLLSVLLIDIVVLHACTTLIILLCILALPLFWLLICYIILVVKADKRVAGVLLIWLLHGLFFLYVL